MISDDMAHVLLDALSALNSAIDGGAHPWDDYETGSDPKSTAGGYRALIGAAETTLETILQGES